MNMAAVKKADRQKRILEIARDREVATQTELKEILKGDGIDVDQGTLSRDIRELGLVRVTTEAGFKYAPVGAAQPAPTKLSGRLVKSAEKSGNLIVVQTDPGIASVAGLAVDKLAWPEVLGTVAGDDTLLVVVREGHSAAKVVKKILDLR